MTIERLNDTYLRLRQINSATYTLHKTHANSQRLLTQSINHKQPSVLPTVACKARTAALCAAGPATVSVTAVLVLAPPRTIHTPASAAAVPPLLSKAKHSFALACEKSAVAVFLEEIGR